MMSFPLTVSIRTGARLHFGPLSYFPETGRHFGGIGMMIEQPGVELQFRRTAGESSAPLPRQPSRTGEGMSTRAAALLKQHRDRHPWVCLPMEMEVFEEIPPHAGLGSGTQLSLAILEGMLRLCGKAPSSEELTNWCGRGERSAIGLHGYWQGGFLVDAGHAPGAERGEVACRIEVPASWRILLLSPRNLTGLHGDSEAAAFQRLPSLPAAVTGRLCRLALTEILPALQQRHFLPFAQALFEYGRLIGEFFAPTQGGVFSAPCLRELVQKIPHVEQTGMAQSSWGPTVALFAEHQDQARQLADQLRAKLPEESVRIEIVSPRNQGRSLDVRFSAETDKAS